MDERLANRLEPRHIGVVQPDQTDPWTVAIGRARPGEAADIAAIHVAVWRNAYPGILPDHTLAGLSRPRLAAYYGMAVRRGACVLVARASNGAETGPRTESWPVGFATASRAAAFGLADGEIETLYVLDDWRERGIGRKLLAHAARHLARLSCRSLFLWVLADNPSRWFYEHLGGRVAMASTVQVGGRAHPQLAVVWDRIDTLTAGD